MSSASSSVNQPSSIACFLNSSVAFLSALRSSGDLTFVRHLQSDHISDKYHIQLGSVLHLLARATASSVASKTAMTSIPSTRTPGMLYAEARSAIVSDALA